MIGEMEDKQRVLIFIDWYAPGYKAGGPTTSNVNIVEHLKGKFDFYIITSNTDYHEVIPYPNIVSDKWIIRDNVHLYYFSREHTYNGLKSAIVDAQCEIWYVNGIYSRFFSIYPLILAKVLKPRKVIVSARGMLSPHAMAIKSIAKRGYLLGAKLCGFFQNVYFHATNQEEAEYIKRQMGDNINVCAIENLPRKIDVRYYETEKNVNEVRLVSFARISPEKNTLFAIQCLKYCKQHVVYHIYGQINSCSYWAECIEAIKQLPANVTVEYMGSVSPNEMPNRYRLYHFLYLPSTGENFGHAILESLMNSSPVIISDNTPWRHLQDQNIGWDLSLKDQQRFAECIDKCSLLSSVEYGIMARNAYEFARKKTEGTFVKQEYISLFTI